MARKKPTLEQILEHASPLAKDAFASIDQGFAAGIRRETILNGVQSVFEGNDEVIEASKAYMEAKYPEKEPRSQEDMVEFGDLDDDNDNEDIESIVWPGGYRFYCSANDSKAELPVRSDKHLVELADVETFKWDGKKGKIGF